ncbi:MAG: signal peptidase I [Colwellia sp.]|nr:signal peptidase I [Colwellia sp.]
MNQWLKKVWKENKYLVVFVSLMLVFRSAVADWNDVPTGSMKPTIVEGDRILVNKMAYDIRLPFTHISLLKMSDPQVGDIIIFDSEVADKKLVKRVVGTPGDVISMTDNILSINGQELNYQLAKNDSSPSGYKDRVEQLSDVNHFVRINNQGSQLSNFNSVVVPKGFYLALGDNRDNSADSRVIGFVPRNEIVGRSKKVVMSLDYDNYFMPRSERFLHTL